MKTNRRKFLSLLGVGTAAGPLAVKVAAEQQIIGLTSLKGAHHFAVGHAADGYPGTTAIGGLKQESPYVMANRYLKMWGKLPAFVEDNIRERSKTVGCLDPDIASKKSWSLNVKIAAQRERNFQYEIHRFTQSGAYEEAQSMFSKITGFQWPW